MMKMKHSFWVEKRTSEKKEKRRRVENVENERTHEHLELYFVLN